MSVNPVERILALREAGRVRRCHTEPWHGDYTIGAHCYDALNILLVLHPNPSIELVKALAWHDSPERWLGDLPAPAKWGSEELARLYSLLEERIVVWLGLQVYLSDGDRAWLEAIDKVELLLAADEQILLGNMAAERIAQWVIRWFADHRAEVPKPILDLVERRVTAKAPWPDFKKGDI